MVAAILDGSKTVTRRTGATWAKTEPGDHLWVRERWRAPKHVGSLSPTEIAFRARDAGYSHPWAPIWFSDGTFNRKISEHDAETIWGGPGRWRPSIHMPRWASRLRLEVVSIRPLSPRPIPEPLDDEQPMGPADETAWRLSVDDAEARAEGFPDAVAFGAAWLGMHGDDHPWPVYRVAFRRIG
jgi:hypothetical protein